MLCASGEQRQQDHVISKFHNVTVWLGRSAVACVEDEEKWREDTYLQRVNGERIKRMRDRELFTNTLCDLLGRKSEIHRASCWLIWKCVWITVERFHIASTVLLVTELWNKGWNAPATCSAQRLRVCPHMLSGLGAMSILVLLRAFTISALLMVRTELSGLSKLSWS